ncbi:MAG TPA: type II toxin-antitoxin system HicA family toxin [Longimicrobium sp.]
MKRRDLIRHLKQHGCMFIREGNSHTIYANARTRKSSAIPRHREINDYLAAKICEDLSIPPP